MKSTTLCFLVRDNEVLLAMKKTGFGVGKWNGVGGKREPGETVVQAAIREIGEEIDVQVAPRDLEARGKLSFSFENNPDWDNETNLFIVRTWTGEPSESGEMRPQWYAQNALPFHEMWVDDPHWLPRVLAGRKINGRFLFTSDGSALLDIDVRERN